MDLNKNFENEEKWKYFLSSIKTFKNLPGATNIVRIKTKHNTQSLSTNFANKLLQKKGGTIELTGKADVLNKYKHLDVRNTEKSYPRSTSDNQLNLTKAGTWPRPRNGNIDIDDSERESVTRVLPFNTGNSSIQVSSDDEESESLLKTYKSRQKGDDEIDETPFIPSKRSRTNNYVESDHDSDAFSDVIPSYQQGSNWKEENENRMNPKCLDVVKGTIPKTDEKSNLLKSEDEVDCAIPSSILPMMNAAKAVAHTFFSNQSNGDFSKTNKKTEGDTRTMANEGQNKLKTNINIKEERTISPKEKDPRTMANEGKNKLKTNINIKEERTISPKEKDPRTMANEGQNKLKTNENIKEEGSISPNEKEAPTCIQVAVEDFLNVNDTININRSRERNKYIPPKKSDIDKACSSWKVHDIAKYFIFDDCVTKINISDNTHSFLDEVYDFVVKDVIRRLETVKGADLTCEKRNDDPEMFMRLKSITSTETGSRLILDALLIPLCSALDIQIEVEKTIDCNFLPSCRFDYCLKRGQNIIGCVEAKSIKSLSDSSVAQALLQLTILQTALATNEADCGLINMPVFAIVTDGHRFIYIQLKGEYLGFEHDGDKLKVREIRNENDFKQIMQHISFLINGEDSSNAEVIVNSEYSSNPEILINCEDSQIAEVIINAEDLQNPEVIVID